MSTATELTEADIIAAWNEVSCHGVLPTEIAVSPDWQRMFVAYLAFPNTFKRFMAMLEETERVLADRYRVRLT